MTAEADYETVRRLTVRTKVHAHTHDRAYLLTGAMEPADSTGCDSKEPLIHSGPSPLCRRSSFFLVCCCPFVPYHPTPLLETTVPSVPCHFPQDGFFFS
jgi:hypothetical protein